MMVISPKDVMVKILHQENLYLKSQHGEITIFVHLLQTIHSIK